LLAGLGLATRQPVIALRQVSEVDLYLHCGEELHLIELKGLTGTRSFRLSLTAANQIAQYWCQKGKWLRTGDEPVRLWSLCPVRWRHSVAEVPKDCAGALEEIKSSKLQGEYSADIGLVFYSVFPMPGTPLRSGHEFLFIMWRADESIPLVTTKGR
jgi:hypothetical protein